MFNFGTTNGHSNFYEYGDLARLDAFTSYSIGIKFYYPSGNSGSYDNRNVLTKTDDITSNHHGWFITVQHDGSSKYLFQMQHGPGSGATDDTYDTAAAEHLLEDVTYSVVFRWDNATDIGRAHVSGFVERETTGLTDLIDSNAMELTIGNHSDTGGSQNTGPGALIGQVIIWANYVLTDTERDQYHAGIDVPAAANLAFWDKCTAEPGADLIQGDAGTENGTVTLTGNNVDNMFAGSGALLPHRQMAGYNIRILACSPELYKFRVPAEYAALSLGADVRIGDGNIPAGTTLLGTLNEHFMLDDWRTMDASILEASIEPNGELSMLVYSRMPAMSLFWNTAAIDKGHLIGDADEGTAAVIPYATKTNSRNSQHFIENASQESDNTTLGSIARFTAKTNHRGTLYEDTVKNLVQNSAFLDDGAGPPTFLDMTEDLGTGATITAVTDTTVPMLFTEDSIQGKPIRAAAFTKGSAGNCLASWSLAIDGSGDAARILIWHRGSAGTYSIQRSDNSRYWDGDSWEVTITHLTFAAATEWTREDTGIIDDTFPTTGTITLSIGIDSGTGLENDVIYFGQVMAYQDWYVASDIVTQGGSTLTSEVDDEVWDLDNGGTHSAQTFNPNRGTIRARLRFTTDTIDMADSIICDICRIGTDATNYDRFYFTRNSGQFKIVGQRVVASVQDGITTLDLSEYTIGQEIEVGYRWTDAGGDELGLSARTLSVFVGGVKGTDDQSTAIHSTSDQTTFIRWGNIASTNNLKIAYIKNCELVQWVIPDEGIQARRVAN